MRLPKWLAKRRRRYGFGLWVRKIHWRKKWQLTPVFFPGKSHEQRSLVGYSQGVTKSRSCLSNYASQIIDISY